MISKALNEDFKPLFLFRSGHRQTILGYFLRKWQKAMPAQLRRLPLPDGDTMHLYDASPPGWKEAGPVVMIVHGLGGCHTSGSVLRLAWECYRQGMRVVRVNMRGSGEGLAEAKKPYHAGCSDDIRLVVHEVSKWAPGSPLWLIGLSLGGNVVLKLAGELRQTEVPLLQKIVAVSPPVDLARCSDMLGQRHNAIYERRFVQELTEMAQQRAKLHGEATPVFPKGLTLRQFDDVYTSRRIGYANGDEYYDKASSRHVLHAIDIPTHILSAEDDPMIDPVPIRDTKRSEAVTIQMPKYGGHLGFISSPGKQGWYWLERQVFQQLR
ncbi:MAG: alpha/beta fold hydrolase [Gemmatales bacterium]